MQPISEADKKALAAAFPFELRNAARAQVGAWWAGNSPPLVHSTFSIVIDNASLEIPTRIYPILNGVSTVLGFSGPLADCLLTRHHNGRVRESALKRVLGLNTPWSAPFVVALIGEYVVEILDIIDRQAGELDPKVYGAFLREDPAFHTLTKQRVASYWDCYYRSIPRSEYVGFRLTKLLDSFASA